MISLRFMLHSRQLRRTLVIAFVSASVFAVRAQNRPPAQGRHAAGKAAFDRGDIEEASRQWTLGQMDAQRTGARDLLAESQRDLATVYILRWQFTEASAALESAAIEPIFDSQVQLQADYVSAGFYSATSNVAAASRDIQDAITLATGALAWGTDHPKTAALYSLAGLIELQSEKYSLADRDLRRALGIFSETYGPQHVETVVARDRYARLLLAQGRYNDALQQEARAIDAARNLGAPARIALADALFTRGITNLAAHRFDDAARSLQECMDLTTAVFGYGIRLLPCLTALAELSLERGEATESWGMTQRTLDLLGANPAADWLPAAEAFRVRARTAARQQRIQEAAPLLEQALQITTKRLGSGSLFAARILETRGDLSLSLGETDRAVADYKEAADIRQRMLTAGHPDLARGLTDIAQVSERRGLPYIAIVPLYTEAIKNITAETGNDSFGLIPTLQRYVSFLRLQQQEREAAEWDKKLGQILGRQE